MGRAADWKRLVEDRVLTILEWQCGDVQMRGVGCGYVPVTAGTSGPVDRDGAVLDVAISLPSRRASPLPPPVPSGSEGGVHCRRRRRWLPQHTFINCWTLSSYESVAMWRMYVGDGNGVAIESTFRRLTDALSREPRPVFVGKVKYIDFELDFVPEENAMQPFIRKRRSFEYEKEVRALTSTLFDTASRLPPPTGEPDESDHPRKSPPSPLGLAIPVDLERMIARVRVSPVSPTWFAQLVDSVIRRYGLRFEVAQSDIAGDPVY